MRGLVGRAGEWTSARRRRAVRGTVTVITGCMFSGKTTDLLQRLERIPPDGRVALKHAADPRYFPKAIVTHDRASIPALPVDSALEIFQEIGPSTTTVALDEAHFFDVRLVEVVRTLCARRIDVVLTALDLDSWGRPFPVTDALLAIADETVRKTATCAQCGGTAVQTQRRTPIVEDRMVGGSESYEARCAACWRPPAEHPPQIAQA